jgi:rSAM/selenodomain-associated transferase 1
LPDRRRNVAIMAKLPRPGRVKTRLARDIGSVSAAWWMRHQTERLIRAVGGDPRWQVWLAVTPDAEGIASRVWSGQLPRIAQGKGDLGARMARVFRRLPPGPAVIVGADIPALRAVHIAAAFQALGSCDAVLGPATDGGYWLVGLKHPWRQTRHLFRGVRWSTGHAMADTVTSLPGRVALLPITLADVDTARDLARPAGGG